MVQFVEAAEAELDQAFHYYYEGELPGLGAEFLVEVSFVVDRVAEFPEAWQELVPGVRRCRLNRFPYGVVYVRRRNEIVVLAVAHLHREPENWLDRLKID